VTRKKNAGRATLRKSRSTSKVKLPKTSIKKLDITAPPVETKHESVPEGKVPDFLTGKFWKDTAEEYVRQNIEKALVRQYRYIPKDCWPEFRIKVGSSTKRVDIVIFRDGMEHKQENTYILVETKQPGANPHAKKDGIAQLQSYMAACVNAEYGLWTNGEQRFCFAKRTAQGKHSFEELTDIPAFGQTEEDAQRPKRKDLMPATGDNLLFAFRRCHNYIAGTEGMQKPEAFWELLKIIFCKIEDERSGVLHFYATPTERTDAIAAAAAKTRIQKIFTEQVVKKYPTFFGLNDQTIELKPNVVAYIVSELQRYSLLLSPVDVKGVAYEEIVGSNLRGDRGEFFTPRNACRMAVTMLDPKPTERLLDPACGTGGFLITAMNHALHHIEVNEKANWRDPNAGTAEELQELYRKRTEYFREYSFGLDLNPALVRAAKMNMVMNNDGSGGLNQADSLANPHTWTKEVAEKVPPGSFDVLFTNPPFGANIIIDDENILRQYDLAAMWDEQIDSSWKMRLDKDKNAVLQKSQPPEILFIERCVQFLKEGTGRMAMVIPNGILNNPALGYVRQWILRNTQVIAVVDMARELFQPKNDTQTSMVLMRRLSYDERKQAAQGKLDYPIFMAVAEKIGHDKRKNAVYRRTKTGDDVLVPRAEVINEIDQMTGQERSRIVEVKERLVDDELPEVAVAFRTWLEENT
jgi:type I restriction enzyme M protein